MVDMADAGNGGVRLRDRDGVGRWRAWSSRPRVAPRPERDTDHDGLSDDAELRRYHTDPRKRDTDRDGLTDGAEVLRYKTNPRKSDSDRDGLTDGAEVRATRRTRAAVTATATA